MNGIPNNHGEPMPANTCTYVAISITDVPCPLFIPSSLHSSSNPVGSVTILNLTLANPIPLTVLFSAAVLAAGGAYPSGYFISTDPMSNLFFEQYSSNQSCDMIVKLHPVSISISSSCWAS